MISIEMIYNEKLTQTTISGHRRIYGEEEEEEEFF